MVVKKGHFAAIAKEFRWVNQFSLLRAAAPAADPGKESGIAGETGKPCDEKFWQMHHHMQDHARRAMCVTGAAFVSIAVFASTYFTGGNLPAFAHQVGCVAHRIRSIQCACVSCKLCGPIEWRHGTSHRRCGSILANARARCNDDNGSEISTPTCHWNR